MRHLALENRIVEKTESFCRQPIGKVFFGLGAGCASFIFFFAIGYASNYFSNFLNSFKIWKIINWMIITIMSIHYLHSINRLYILNKNTENKI